MKNKTSNKQARHLIEQRIEFEGSNTFGKYEGFNYVVYSYGYHFPIYLFNGINWYGNIEKYSVTTSKHQSQLKPDANIKYVSTIELKNLIYKQ